jgi:hypothetical protein
MSETQTIEITAPRKRVVRKDLTEEDKQHLALLNKIKKDKKLDETKVIDEIKDKDYDYLGRGILKALLQVKHEQPPISEDEEEEPIPKPVKIKTKKPPRIIEHQSDEDSPEEIIVIPNMKKQMKATMKIEPMPAYAYREPEPAPEEPKKQSRYGKKENPTFHIPKPVDQVKQIMEASGKPQRRAATHNSKRS